jgi:hypothetical protein
MQTIFRQQCDECRLFKFARGVELWQRPLCHRSRVHAAFKIPERKDSAGNSRNEHRKPSLRLLSNVFHSPFFDAAHVMDSSVYNLASALNGRRVGRMTPRSSTILHLAPILLPGRCVRALA